MTFDRAVEHIEKWYRYGDRFIAVPFAVMEGYLSGLTPCNRYSATAPAPDKFGRRFFAYKAAIVYYPDNYANALQKVEFVKALLKGAFTAWDAHRAEDSE